MPNADQKTDGKGTKKSLVQKLTDWLNEVDDDNSEVDADLEVSNTPDTPTDDKTGGDDSAEADDKTPKAGDDDSNADGEANDGEGDKPKLFTQDEVNAIIEKRLAKVKKPNKNMKSDDTALTARLEALEKQIESYKAEEAASVKSKFEKLPEEVRELAPGSIDTDEGVAAIKDWLPKADKLAKSLAESVKSVKAGNSGDPKIKSQKELDDEAALIKKAKAHSIYKSF